VRVGGTAPVAIGCVTVADGMGLGVAVASQGRGACASWIRKRPNAANKKMSAAKPMSRISEVFLCSVM